MSTKQELFDEIFTPDLDLYMGRFNKPAEFVSRDSKNLFVTIGDNWVRGFDFDQGSPGIPFPKLENRFGDIISEQTGWDLLDLSFPSMSNLAMAQNYQKICANVSSLGYERVKVLITLTEYGREFCTKFDAEVPALLEAYKTCATALDVMHAISDQVAEMLSIETEVELTVGLAYTSNLYPTTLSCLPMSWLEVLKNQPVTEFSVILLDEFINHFSNLAQLNPAVNESQLIDEIAQLRAAAASRRQMIYDTGYTPSDTMCWPNAAAHALWAQYILDNVTF